jgi:hypothetical protein
MLLSPLFGVDSAVGADAVVLGLSRALHALEGTCTDAVLVGTRRAATGRRCVLDVGGKDGSRHGAAERGWRREGRVEIYGRIWEWVPAREVPCALDKERGRRVL